MPKQLKDAFNSDHHTAHKMNDNVLQVTNCGYSATTRYYYDFATRTLMMMISGGTDMMAPFSQLDHEVLTTMRDKLIELGGDPPELPQPAPVLFSRKSGITP